MGLFGGGNSSSTTKNYTSNQTTTTNQQSTVAGQDDAIVLGKDARYSYNYELVNPDAQGIIKETNNFLGENFNSMLGFADSTVENSLETVQASQGKAYSFLDGFSEKAFDAIDDNMDFVEQANTQAIDTVSLSNKSLANELLDQKTAGAGSLLTKSVPLIGVGVIGLLLYKVIK